MLANLANMAISANMAILANSCQSPNLCKSVLCKGFVYWEVWIFQSDIENN